MTIPGTVDHEWIAGDGRVPPISDDVLAERLTRMQPIIAKEGKLFSILQPHPRNQAFTWSPRLDREIMGLEEFARFEADHTCGYHGLFKPSIAEVLAQIPEEFVEKAKAFRVATEVGIKIYKSGSHHRSTVALYA